MTTSRCPSVIDLMRYWCIPYSSARTQTILKSPRAFEMYGLGIIVTVCPAWNLCAFIVQLPFELGPGRLPGIDSAEGCEERKLRLIESIGDLFGKGNALGKLAPSRGRTPKAPWPQGAKQVQMKHLPTKTRTEANVLKIQQNWAKRITQTRLRIPSALAYSTDWLPV
jgi:hypothetical protein